MKNSIIKTRTVFNEEIDYVVGTEIKISSIFKALNDGYDKEGVCASYDLTNDELESILEYYDIEDIVIETLLINAKCSDSCNTQLIDNEGRIAYEKNGYVPDGLNIGGGDYIRLFIDIKTGQILNWKDIDVKEVTKKFKKYFYTI